MVWKPRGAWLALGLAILGLPNHSWARLDTVPGSRYISARGAAMGDAYLPLAENGAEALTYNPAALADIREFNVELVNFTLEPNQDHLTYAGVSNLWRAHSLPLMKDTLTESAEGIRPGTGYVLFPNFYWRGFGAGVLAQAKMYSSIQGGVIRYRSLYQLIPTAGFGFNLAKGIVRFGYSLQWVHETSGESGSQVDGDLSYAASLNKGSTFSHMLAWALTFPYKYLPGLNVVARNIGAGSWNSGALIPVGTDIQGTPTPQRMSIDVSLHGAPKLWRDTFSKLVFVYRDLTSVSGMSLLGRLAVGAELSFNRGLLNLRFGLGGGYPSAGVGLRSGRGSFDFSWYSQETGQEFRGEREIRWMISYSAKLFKEEN